MTACDSEDYTRLRRLVRDAVRTIATLEPSEVAAIDAAVGGVRAELAARGLGPRCHEPDTGWETWPTEKELEWWAGVLLGTVDDREWGQIAHAIEGVWEVTPRNVPGGCRWCDGPSGGPHDDDCARWHALVRDCKGAYP